MKYLIGAILLIISCGALQAQERRDWGHGGAGRPGPQWHYHGHDAPRYYGHGGGWGGGGWGNFGGALAGGAIGSWFANQWSRPEPAPVVVVQPQEAPPRTVGWCLDRYRSYDPQSRSYLGFDGYRHSCP